MLAQSRRITCSVQDIFAIRYKEILAGRNARRPCIIQPIGIAERIKELRERKGLNQSELARLVGVKPQAVQLWEKPGGTAPKRTRLEKVATTLGVSVTDLLANSDEKFPPMRDDVRRLIDKLVDVGARNLLAIDDISTLNKMLNHMVSSAIHDHPSRRDSDWLIGGPAPKPNEDREDEKDPRN